MDWKQNGPERRSGKDFGDRNGFWVKLWKICDYFVLCFTLWLFAVNFGLNLQYKQKQAYGSSLSQLT